MKNQLKENYISVYVKLLKLQNVNLNSEQTISEITQSFASDSFDYIFTTRALRDITEQYEDAKRTNLPQ